jgi:hypothetical protein
MLHCPRLYFASIAVVCWLEMAPCSLPWWEAERWSSAGEVKWARAFCRAAAAEEGETAGAVGGPHVNPQTCIVGGRRGQTQVSTSLNLCTAVQAPLQMTLLVTIFLIVLLTEVVEWVGKPVLLQFVSKLQIISFG